MAQAGEVRDFDRDVRFTLAWIFTYLPIAAADAMVGWITAMVVVMECDHRPAAARGVTSHYNVAPARRGAVRRDGNGI